MQNPTGLRWVWLAALVVSLGLCACKDDAKEATATASAEASTEKAGDKVEEKAIPVKVMTLVEETVTPRVEISGLVASDLDVTILSETSGRVVRDNLDLGNTVKKGTALVVVDHEPYRIAVESAQAALDQAQASKDQAEREHARMKTLRESNDISESQYDVAHFALLQAKAALAMAESQLASAKRSLRLASVRAPFDGVIASTLVKLGDTLAPGTPVAQLVNTKQVKVTAGVGEDRIGSLTVGQKAVVRFPTLNDLRVDATVKAVGAKALQPTMTYPLELQLDKLPESVRVGMVCRVDLPVGQPMQALRFPIDSLVDRFDRQYVYVVNEDKTRVKEQRVQTGISLENHIILTEGVQAGDVLVMTGQANLKDGSLIQIVE